MADGKTQFQIHQFWTTYKPDRHDPAKLIPIDMVLYGPVGGKDKTAVPATVNSILGKLQDIGESSNNIAVQMAHARANFMRPYYEAWKKGQELPVDGTPLAAWNGVSLEQATILRTNGFRTVEDVAQMTETHVTSIKLPGLRELKKQAQRFIDSADQTRFAAELSKRDDELAALKASSAERDEQFRTLQSQMDQLTTSLAAKMDAEDEAPADGSVPKRGPGRPRKLDAAAA